VPGWVQGLKATGVKSISSSNNHSAIVTSDGQVLACGSKLHGKLGADSSSKKFISKFQPLMLGDLSRKKAKQVACGDYHTLILTEDCSVFTCGGTRGKQEGSQPVQALMGKDVLQIDCGDFHSAALTAHGQLYTWGGGQPSYNKGQTGHGHQQLVEHPEVVQYFNKARVVKVACGGFHTLVLTSDNELYGFGSGVYGECGHGQFIDSSTPKMIVFPDESGDQDPEVDNLDMYLQEVPVVKSIAAGGHHSLVLTNRGKLFSFGFGSHGQLGLRSTHNYAKPQLVKDFSGRPISLIAAGWNHSLALTEVGDLYACGHALNGQLGLGEKQSKTSFTHISSLGPKNIFKVFAGGNHSWVVIDDVMPNREYYVAPSPLQPPNLNSISNTPN